MLWNAIVIGFIGVICMLDSRLLGRMNFERPLITCTFVGIALGNIPVGLAVGASVELMSLGIVNIGGALPPDMCMAAIITSAYAILTSATTETALALAVPIAVLGQIIGVVGRTVLGMLTHVADHAIEQGDFRKAQRLHIVWGTLIYSLLYFVPIFLAIYAGTGTVEAIVSMIPGWLTNGLNLGTKFLTAYGLALLLSTMLNKEMTIFFFLGFFTVGYLGLDITAIAIFATILALILSSVRFRNNPVGAAVNAQGAITKDDYDPLEDD